jgi:hypothetical protein
MAKRSLLSSSSSTRKMAFAQPGALLVSHGRSCLRLSRKPLNRPHLSLHKQRCNIILSSGRERSVNPTAEYPSCVPAEAAKEIQDATARSLLSEIQVEPVRTEFCDEPIETAFVQTGKGSQSDPILVFIHSFDSNLLEFRRIWPLLKHASATSYAVDVLGWGFTSKPGHLAYSVEEKRGHLRSFVKQVIGDSPVVFVGASVGGAVAMDFALKYPEDVSQLVLIGAQAFVNKESSPILEKIKPLASLGAAVLKARWLRRIAVRLSYVSPELKNEDSVRVGRLHTLTPGWDHATEKFVSFHTIPFAIDA